MNENDGKRKFIFQFPIFSDQGMLNEDESNEIGHIFGKTSYRFPSAYSH